MFPFTDLSIKMKKWYYVTKLFVLTYKLHYHVQKGTINHLLYISMACIKFCCMWSYPKRRYKRWKSLIFEGTRNSRNQDNALGGTRNSRNSYLFVVSLHKHRTSCLPFFRAVELGDSRIITVDVFPSLPHQSFTPVLAISLNTTMVT